MLVNNPKDKTEHIEFVKYDASHYAWCSGVLTLKIDGTEYKFGHDSLKYCWKSNRYLDEDPANPNFDKFWETTGHIDSDFDIHKGEWEIDYSKIPEQFRQYAVEIDKIFNDNVEWGCCGGCI